MITKWFILLSLLPIMLSAVVHDQYIVTLQDPPIGTISVASLPKNWTRMSGLESHNTFSVQQVQNYAIVANTDGRSDKEMSQFLTDHPRVREVEPVYPIQLHSTYNDIHFAEQSYLSHAQLAPILSIPAQHEIIVAVVDTGIDWSHSDLDGQILYHSKDVINGKDDDGNGYIDDRYGADFYGYSKDRQLRSNSPTDEFGHGTHIAGIIGAKTNNQIGIVGLNPNIKLMNVKFLNKWGRGNQVDAAYAIRYAVDHGARVINCSWGYFRYNKILKDAIQYALNHDVVVVAAMGNSNINIPEYPAAFPGVIAIGSISSNQKRSGFSSYGDHMDFVMNGESVFSLMPQNKYGTLTGTSQSAALVSGLISRLLAYDDTLSVSRVKDILIASTQDLGQKGHDPYTGYGQIDSEKLLALLDVEIDDSNSYIVNQDISTARTVANIINYPNPVQTAGTTFSFSDSAGQNNIRIQVFNTMGEPVFDHSTISSQGPNRVYWNATDDSDTRLMRGIYFWVLTIQGDTVDHQSRHRLAIL